MSEEQKKTPFVPATKLDSNAGMLVDDFMKFFDVSGEELNDEIRSRSIKLQGRPSLVGGYTDVWIRNDDLAEWLSQDRQVSNRARATMVRKNNERKDAKT